MQTETLTFEVGTSVMFLNFEEKDYMCFTLGEQGRLDNASNYQTGILANTTVLDLDLEDQVEDSNGNLYTRVYEYYYFITELFNNRPPLK